MITHAEDTNFRELLDKIAYREYVRGLENGWGICEVTINWLRMNATKIELIHRPESIGTRA